ncbi:MAG: AAA family ATPase [Eubacteriales bacterium]|nr:AAA family ATPase [Eubacteriales bacterium]
MNKEWTLHVENLAKIKDADVTIAPFMCFVGDNNSGKSYLMSVLWGVLTLGKDLFPKIPSDAKCYRDCENWLKAHMNVETELLEADICLYLGWFNELLNINKKGFIKKIFNYDIEIGKIKIIDYKRKKPIKIKWDKPGARYSVTENYIKFPEIDLPSRDELLRMNAYICWNLLMEGIAAPLYTPIIKGRRTGEPIYLPASRTGFMLTFSQLIEKSLQISFSPELHENTSMLTLPYVDFLQLITKFEINKKSSKKYVSIIEYIENNMTKGNLTVKKDMMPVIQYIPEGDEKEIPLYAASSVVSEISPLLLILKSGINFKAIIIEEPEAHLHPELQQKMARLMINLMNLGVPVWITTHSDTILQHMNNMMKLRNHTQCSELMKEYGYNKDDLLDENDIKMYQFLPECDGKTHLTSLEATNYGFVVPTFNNALEQIVKEVYAFQEE